MKSVLFCLVTFIVVNIDRNNATQCGCKSLRPCYEEMLSALLDRDEAACVEDAAIGGSTVTIFLKALQQFCGSVFKLKGDQMTFEGRHLYEAVLTKEVLSEEAEQQPKPVVIIEAGQQAGSKPVELALHFMEQLVACEELDEMLQGVKWVVLPCTNPDGQEYARYSPVPWRKNLKPSPDQLSFGVDITRNFDVEWSSCPKVDSGFSQIYPGPFATSENETVFIKSIIEKYKKDAKVYISLRRDGHSINYPYGYKEDHPENEEMLKQVAGDVAARVNQRTGISLNTFENRSIFMSEGKKYCGHSVDYAFDSGIPLCYEMKVFLGSDGKIMSKFLPMPRGHDTSMRNGYFSGLRELFKIITNEKKYRSKKKVL